MRLSVRQGANRTRKRCRRLRVYLNDQEVTCGTFALDTREGWIRRFVRVGEDGPVLIDRVRHQPVTMQQHGRVRVERRAARPGVSGHVMARS